MYQLNLPEKMQSNTDKKLDTDLVKLEKNYLEYPTSN